MDNQPLTEAEVMKRKEDLLRQVKEKIGECENIQEEYAQKFEEAANILNNSLKTLLDANELLEAFIDKNRDYVFEQSASFAKIDRKAIQLGFGRVRQVYEDCVKPLRDLLSNYSVATSLLHQLVNHLRTSCNMISAIEIQYLGMTEEDLIGIEYPDFLWAKNNFIMGHFDLTKEADELKSLVVKSTENFKWAPFELQSETNDQVGSTKESGDEKPTAQTHGYSLRSRKRTHTP